MSPTSKSARLQSPSDETRKNKKMCLGNSLEDIRTAVKDYVESTGVFACQSIHWMHDLELDALRVFKHSWSSIEFLEFNWIHWMDDLELDEGLDLVLCLAC